MDIYKSLIGVHVSGRMFYSKGSGQASEMLSHLEKSGVETNIYDKVGQ